MDMYLLMKETHTPLKMAGLLDQDYLLHQIMDVINRSYIAEQRHGKKV